MTARGSKKTAGLEPSLKTLTINSTKTPTKLKQPPDSWEEEADSPSHATSSSTTPTSPSTPIQDAVPNPPPPTPISPTHRRGKSTDWAAFPQTTAVSAPRSSPRNTLTSENDKPEKRPEKSSATAGRMIAGALGVKGPKLSEEQRQYERVVREKERKRVEIEREEANRRERERERAKEAVWED